MAHVQQEVVSGAQVVSTTTATDTQPLKVATAFCPAGKKVTGGAWELSNAFGQRIRGYQTQDAPLMDGSGWTVGARLAPDVQATWRLIVYATCADASGLAGYEVTRAPGTRWVQEAKEFPSVTCPTGKKLLGGGWAVHNNSTGAILEGHLTGASSPQDDGRGWRTSSVGPADAYIYEFWSSYAYAVCANATSLTNQQVVLSETGLDYSNIKSLTVSCPPGRRATAVGWSSVDEAGYTWKTEQDFLAVSQDAATWTVQVTHESRYFPNGYYYAWKLQARLVCTDPAAPDACAGLNEMTFSSSGPTQWPAACWRPFDVTGNPFNKPIPTTARTNQLHSNSPAIVTRLLAGGRPGELLGRRDGHAGEPTYYAQPTDPQYIIRCRNDSEGAPDGHCLALEGKTVRIPAWARPEGGVARAPLADRPDTHMTLINRSEGVQYDFWHVQTSPLPTSPTSSGTLPEIFIGAGNRIQLNSTGLYAAGNQTSTSYGIGRNGTAGFFAGQLGKIRLEELQAGQINHALFMVVRCQSTTEGVVYPAAGPGGRKCIGDYAAENDGAPAMGAHFFYDRSPEEIDGLPLPAWKRTILKALSRYGAFVGDTGGRWGFDQESGYQYLSVPNGERRWFDYGSNSAQGWQLYRGDDGVVGTNDDQYYGRLYDLAGATDGPQQSDIDARDIINFPRYLKVLKPCVSQGTCT